jgi:hypothetical protein
MGAGCKRRGRKIGRLAVFVIDSMLIVEFDTCDDHTKRTSTPPAATHLAQIGLPLVHGRMVVAAASSPEREYRQGAIAMKSLAWFAAICAVVLSAEATKTANAATLSFDFSFTDALFGHGTVTGEVEGLSDNSTGPASAVFLDSFSSDFGSICSTPCNTMASPWVVFSNFFTVSNGQVKFGDFDSINFSNLAEFSFFGQFGPFFGDLHHQSIDASGRMTFSPVTSPTPLPAALPLFATGLGALGLLGWRRKRKARAVA